MNQHQNICFYLLIKFSVESFKSREIFLKKRSFCLKIYFMKSHENFEVISFKVFCEEFVSNKLTIHYKIWCCYQHNDYSVNSFLLRRFVLISLLTLGYSIAILAKKALSMKLMQWKLYKSGRFKGDNVTVKLSSYSQNLSRLTHFSSITLWARAVRFLNSWNTWLCLFARLSSCNEISMAHFNNDPF